MKIIRRYVLYSFLKPFLQGICALLLIMIITHFFDYMHKFLANKPSVSLLTRYFAFRIPEWFVTITPVATLLGILFSLGTLNRTNEITAIRTSGIKLSYILMPLVVFSIFLSIGTGIMYEAIVPKTTMEAERLFNIIRNKADRDIVMTRKDLTYMGAEDMVYRIGLFEDNTIKGFQIIQFFPGTFREKRRISAEKAVYKSGIWTLYSVSERTFSVTTGETESYKKHNTMEFNIPETPDDFSKPALLPDQMNIVQLFAYIKKLDKGGFSSIKEKVLLHYKISFPFANTVILILGIPIALWGAIKSRATSFFIAILVCFLYWGALSTGKALGGNGVLSPFLGAWAANIAFFLLSVLMMKKIKII